MSTEFVVDAFKPCLNSEVTVSSGLAFDLNKASQAVLCADARIGEVGADLLDLWPKKVRNRFTAGFGNLLRLA